MSRVSDLIGTIFNSFRIGLGTSALILKNVSGVLNLRNSTDTALVGLNADSINGTTGTFTGGLYGYRPQVPVSENKTINGSDLNTLQVCNAASAITIPTDATGGSDFTVGNVELEVFVNTSGTVTLVGATGVTFLYRNALGAPISGTAITVTTAGQYAFLFAKRIAANTWGITGATT